MSVATDATKVGRQSSEFKLVLAAMVLGALLELAAVPVLVWAGHAWPVCLVLVLAGGALQCLALAGYVKSRTNVKAAMLAPPPQPPAEIRIGTVQSGGGNSARSI